MLNRIRCPYCAECLEIGEMLDHLPQCEVRTVALEAEATLGRILTADEIAALRERAIVTGIRRLRSYGPRGMCRLDVSPLCAVHFHCDYLGF